MSEARGREHGRGKLGFAWVGLVVLAILSAVIWRLEIEWRGWEGSGWISYDHLAIPFGALLYLAWVAAFAPIARPVARLVVVVVLLLLGLVAWGVLGVALPAFFATLAGLADPSLATGTVALLLFPISWILIPVGTNFLGRICAGTSRGRFLASTALFLIAWPLASLLLLVVPQPGPGDAIHALKTGFLIPFVFVALGIPFLPHREPKPWL